MSKNIFCLIKTCVLIQKAPDTAMNFWPFRWQSTLDASQTWLQLTDNCTHIRGKVINFLTETGHLYAPKNFCLIETCVLISNSIFYSTAMNSWHLRL